LRNIVTDPNDAAIAKMMVALSENMGISVIAKGVVLQAQVDLLARLGCQLLCQHDTPPNAQNAHFYGKYRILSMGALR